MPAQKSSAVDINLENKQVSADQFSTDELPTIEFPSRGKLKASSWRIHQKIGYGYFLAIGIGFFGSLTGLFISNSYRSIEIRKYNHAHYQVQMLSDYQDALVGTQLYSSSLVATLTNPQQLAYKKFLFFKSVENANDVENKIRKFLEDKPGKLAATENTLQALLHNYSTNLHSYVNQIDLVLQQIDQQPQTSQQLSSSQNQLLAIMRGDKAVALDRVSQQLSNILQNAQQQEQEITRHVDHSKEVERAIVIFSMLLSVAIAAIIAWRTSRALAEPVILVTQVAEQVARKSNFDLRAPHHHRG